MIQTYISHNEDETAQVGEMLAKTLKNGDFVAMFGDLGVGKTAFVRGMARYFAPEVDVTSPSYSLCHAYKGQTTLNHLDLYRIVSEDDLESIGFYDLLSDGVTVAEWCERIPASIPADAVRVSIFRTDRAEDERKIVIEHQ